MRKLFIILLTSYCLLLACNRKEVSTVLQVRFSCTILNNNYSVPVTVQITNETIGASNYKWSFEGGSPAEYLQKEPGIIVFNKAGNIKVSLEAWNSNERKRYDTTIVLDSAVKASFSAEPVVNNFAPAEFNMSNMSQGSSVFNWQFIGSSNMPSSSQRAPTAVRYDNPGNYTIKLEVKNAKGVMDTITKMVTVRPGLSAAFDIAPSFDDDDMEAPLTATLNNHTISAISHQWFAVGGSFANAADSITTVTFTNPGTYTVNYTASNGKQTQTISKTITVLPNSYLRSFQNVQLGINTAQNSIGCYFSSRLRNVFKPAGVNAGNGHLMDIVFFGLSESFSFNKFTSPDSATSLTFPVIANATHTIFVNKQESCGCSASLTAAGFDAITNGNSFNALNITETAGGLGSFNDALLPRVVLFSNAAGKKGAIKIKQFVSAGQQSYIVADIKVQKD